MPNPSTCNKQRAMQNNNEERTQGRYQHCYYSWQPPYGLFLLLIMLASWTSICQGAPFSSNMLRAEQELQLWNEIDDACSAMLSDSQVVVSSHLEELCFMAMGILQKSQGSEEKDDSKREEVQGPGGVLSRGYFLFRPRNGRRSASFR
ncbi:neuromedin-U isoform X3 [Pyxicephalus adspersus]|uniref:neuromedin-U isoform X3 n=1 Tax=Pyxicephalus adspersus TaxID=30357 RepID=UPI003B5A28E4